MKFCDFLDSEKTVIQLATAQGTAAIHVLRLSGKKSLDFLKEHLGLRDVVERRVYVARFKAKLNEDDYNDELETRVGHGFEAVLNPEKEAKDNKEKTIDKVVCFYMKAPNSYTGEDMAEVHCHGSMGIVRSILKVALDYGLELAGPGLFTWRAFLNRKVSLEQAEAVDALVKAGNENARKNALKMLEGKASLDLGTVRKSLVGLMATLESSIEFPEEDIPEVPYDRRVAYPKYIRQLAEIVSHLEAMIDNYEVGRREQEGYRVLIMGRSNAGKSTLMNVLLREERVIVSEEEGTTRDSIEERIELKGISVRLTDCAGFRKEASEVESIGIARSLQLLYGADLVVYLLYSKKCLETLLEYRSHFLKNKSRVLYLLSKTDLWKKEDLESFFVRAKTHGVVVSGEYSMVSEPRINVIARVEGLIAKQFDQDENHKPPLEGLGLLNERQCFGARMFMGYVERAIKFLRKGETEDIVLETLRETNELLNEIDVPITNEEIYDKVFKSFCLGK